MSRNTSKLRIEKNRVTSACPPAPTLTEDPVDPVAPGCLTKSEFLTMIAHEEGEEIVAEIMDELMTHVMKKCNEVYLRKQVVPFTVAWSKKAMLQLVYWHYLRADEGDGIDTISSLQEDKTPAASILDSWAQGCVPVIEISNPSQSVQSDTQEVNVKDLQKNPKAQSINNRESSLRKPRPRNGRSLKVISASHAELERKPHPPKTPSPNKLKPPQTQNLLQY